MTARESALPSTRGAAGSRDERESQYGDESEPAESNRIAADRRCRGGVEARYRSGWAAPAAMTRSRGVDLAESYPRSVSSTPSSNWTCGFPASSSRTGFTCKHASRGGAPSNAQDSDFAVEVPVLEKRIKAGRGGHDRLRGRIRSVYVPGTPQVLAPEPSVDSFSKSDGQGNTKSYVRRRPGQAELATYAQEHLPR